MLFIATYLFFILLPGWLLASALRMDQNKTLLSVALSVGIAMINLIVIRKLGVAYTAATAVTIVEVLVLSGVMLWTNPIRPRLARLNTGLFSKSIFWGVLTVVAVYTWVAGPYLEVPADPWWHIAKINGVLDTLTRPDYDAVSWGRLWNEPNLYGYFVPALAASLGGYSTVEILDELNLVNTLLFCAGIYTFALYVFNRSGLDDRQMYLCAALTVLFMVVQFGVNVFSYVRYYVYAPAFIGYLVYMSAVAVLLEFYRKGAWRCGSLVFVFLLFTAYLVHKQEFLFIILMASLVVVLEYAYSRDAGNAPGRTATRSIFYVVLAGWLMLWSYSYINLNRANPLAYNTIISLEEILPFLRNLYVADPTYQFYEVIGVWGFVVYILFFHALIKGERLSSFLTGGMLVPLVTIFNPFFVDLFLRHNYPDVIWRICYMIPLPFLGAYFFTRALSGLFRKRGTLQAIASAAVALSLLVLLLPVSTTFLESRFSRLYTLKPVIPEVGYQQWQDVVTFLGTMEKEIVITDQVTGYLINALTPHYYRGHKFYGFGAPKISRKQYSESSFSEFAGSLVIVNRRDGGLSETGKVSGHWPENILKVSRFYSPGFLALVENNPKKFKKIWDKENIQVYEIQS